MTTPYIIELSRKNADFYNIREPTTVNSEWKNTIKSSVMVEEGDQISIRNVFINTGDDIVIDNDLQVTLEFGYYDVNTFWSSAKTSRGTVALTQADNDYYIAYSMGKRVGTLVSWKVRSPVDLSVAVYFTFQYTDPAGNIQYFTSKRWYSSYSDDPEVTLTWAKYGNSSTAPQMVEDSLKCTAIEGQGTKFTSYVASSAVFSNEVVSGNTPLIKNMQFVVPQGIYTKNGFAKALTDLMQSLPSFSDSSLLTSGSNFLLRTDDEQFDDTKTGGLALYFTKAGVRPDDTTSNSKSYQYKDTSGGASNLSSYWFGASQISLIWDDDTSQFAWEYIHTPFATAGAEGVSIVKDGSTYSTVTEQTGIYFKSLEPVTLWQDILGFDMTSILCSDDIEPNDPLKSCLSKQQLLSKTTHGFLALETLLPSFNRAVQSTTINGAINVTLMLKANNIYSNASSGGFFLVEVSFTGKKYYYYGDRVNGAISAIVSNYSLQDNYVTGYSDSSVNYIHQGAPFNLNNFSVRILDANTKQPIKSLGQNSFVFVQVDKGIILPVQKNMKRKIK